MLGMMDTLSQKIVTEGLEGNRLASSIYRQMPRYIAVEGPIGVGKTTLVEKLSARLQARKILEVFEENPFLPLFYRDRQRYAFQTEMFFLLSRYQQQKEISQQDLFAPVTLSDYLFVKTRLFAGLTLTDDELILYDRVYASLEVNVARPELVIYLHGSVPVLMERIKRRGRPMEAFMDREYLTDLTHIYANFFRDYADSRLLSVNADEFNFASDESSLEFLLQSILAMNGSRAYLEGPQFSLETAS